MSRKSDALARLYGAKERNELDAERMNEQRARFQKIKGRHENGTAPRAVSAFNLFPTPPDVARLLVGRAGIEAAHRVLEPSAGTGRILDALPACHAVAVEISRDLGEHLYKRYPRVSLKIGDFLTRTAADLGGLFDRVVMNPPFKHGIDVKHIQHAHGLLRPGGLLVAFCFNGSAQNKHLKPMVDTWEVLPEGSFGSEGTRASVALITWRK